MSTPPAAESPAHLKVLCFMLLGFGLVLLSMFFFYVARDDRTLIARRTVVAGSRSFLCFAHGPPITLLHRYGRNTPHLATPSA